MYETSYILELFRILTFNIRLMLTMEEYACKSSEKSSPSFPEDADDEDEHVKAQYSEYIRPPSNGCRAQTESPLEPMATDVTMVAEDEDEEMDSVKIPSTGIESPKPSADTGDKKVHWTTRHVQLLLDRVEDHLHEFNVQKKHKAVWQAIGIEMEPYGFTTEHCYNKWKNLRRDVRLLVNNPMKVVRNASILRRVARLILVIYPNVDATTMQVCDRSGIKSTPVTPGGPGSTVKSMVSDNHLSGMNSPHCKLDNSNLSRLTNALYNPGNDLGARSTPSTVEKSFCVSKSSTVPGTALFVNSLSDGVTKSSILAERVQPEPDSTAPLPFPFNPAAAALLLQSQLFSNIVKQQQHQQEEIKPQERVHDLSSAAHNDVATALQHALSNPLSSTDFSTLPTLTANLLNSLVGLTSQVAAESNVPNLAAATNLFPPNISPNILEPFVNDNKASEITGLVERLQAEEAVHFRLMDTISHLADELRAAGQRRQATLTHLVDLVKGNHTNNSAPNASATRGDGVS